MRRFSTLVAAWFLVFLVAEPLAAPAASIASFTGGTVANAAGFYGQSFTTAAGSTATNITFNFYSDAASTMPFAAGTAYLLNEAYGGTPSALSPSTPGFLGQATAAGNVFSFGSVTLLPSTQYFLYDNTLIAGSSFMDRGPTREGGITIRIYPALLSSWTLFSSNLLVTGTLVSSVPEPSSLVLAGMAATAVALFHLVQNGRRPFPIRPRRA